MPKATIIEMESNDLKKSVFLSHPTIYWTQINQHNSNFINI